MTIAQAKPVLLCTSCGGPTLARTVTDVVERNQTTVVLTHVPAQVCERCGRTEIDADTRLQMLAILDRAVRDGRSITRQAFAAAGPEGSAPGGTRASP